MIASRGVPGHVAFVARRVDRSLERWLVLGAAAVLVAVEVAVSADLRALIRATARTSCMWFVLAFVARPLVVLGVDWPGKWLLRNRRYLGLAMAISHAAHLVAIVAVANLEGSVFWDKVSASTLVGGGFGYVMLAAMVATSWDGAQTWLGRRRWRALHLVGMWTFWVIFTLSYPPLLLVGALRAWAATKGWSARSARGA
jgi:sulfoxide reductase heme-binding subunit YedZ